MFPTRLLRLPLAATAAGTGLLLLAFGGDAVSYASTFVGSARELVTNEVPVDFQLQRARKMIEGLDPAVRAYQREMAQCQVKLEDLDADIAAIGQRLQQRDEALRRVSEQAARARVVGLEGNSPLASPAHSA